MNNNANFDPITGQPINNTQINPNIQNVNTQPLGTNYTEQQTNVNQSVNNIPTVPSLENGNNSVIQTNTNTSINQQYNQMQAIPTIDQNKQDFINNTQSISNDKKEEKTEGINYAFLIIIFIIMFAAIFFLFPILLKHI